MNRTSQYKLTIGNDGKSVSISNEEGQLAWHRNVPSIHDFLNGIKTILKPTGTVTFEFPHVLQMIIQNQFDTIYHEHYSYYSLLTVIEIFKKHGLEVYDVEEQPTHGGSLRIFGKHTEDKTKSLCANIQVVLEKEAAHELTKIDGYSGFQESVDAMKDEFVGFLLQEKKAGKKIAAYAAAAKGNTMINYFGIRKDVIQYVVDKSPHKQGKFLPASHIPIVAEEMIRETKPDWIVILAWNIKEEIMEQLSYIKEWGGQFVVAIPKLTIL